MRRIVVMCFSHFGTIPGDDTCRRIATVRSAILFAPQNVRVISFVLSCGATTGISLGRKSEVAVQ